MLLTGPNDVEKSSVVVLLSNFFIRMGWSSLFLDLDVDYGIISLPGSVATGILNDHWNINEEISYKSTVVFYFGHLSPREDIRYYKTLIERLANVLKNEKNRDLEEKIKGFHINTIGLVDGLGYELLLHQ